MKVGLKRQKSISSQAASISAWCTVFDWFSIVAALTVARHGPASSSAARSRTAARSSHVCSFPALSATAVRYRAGSFGVGELWLDGDLVLEHELPRAGEGDDEH